METSFKEIVCPIDAEWKFKKADLMDLYGFMNGKHFYAFNIPGLQYFIRIYPNGFEAFHGLTCIYFFAHGSKERKINADYTVSIESANYSVKLNVVNENNEGCGKVVCKTAEFFEYKSKYFINGEITIKIKGTLKVKRSSVSVISTYVSTQWKIKENDLKEAMNNESKTRLYSKIVNLESFFDNKYYLSICPSDTNNENRSTAFIYLHVNPKKVVFNFSVNSVNFNYGIDRVFDNLHGWGFPLCSTQDLFDPSKGYFADGILTINFQGVLITENNRYITLNCKKEVTTKSAMKNDEKEFVIVSEEKEIHVHKQVLSDVSPVFARMLESGMKEAIKNKICISDFSFKIVDISIMLCYGNSILIKYALETLLSIYRFGDKYRIGFIMDLIEEYLIKEISPMNIVYLIKFSSPDSFNVKKLHQSCIEFLIKCVKESTPMYAFESLDKTFLASLVLNSLCPNVDTHRS